MILAVATNQDVWIAAFGTLLTIATMVNTAVSAWMASRVKSAADLAAHNAAIVVKEVKKLEGVVVPAASSQNGTVSIEDSIRECLVWAKSIHLKIQEKLDKKTEGSK